MLLLRAFSVSVRDSRGALGSDPGFSDLTCSLGGAACVQMGSEQTSTERIPVPFEIIATVFSCGAGSVLSASCLILPTTL